MPKSTFFNLPEEKRNRITEAAIEEFSKNLFHKASITRIVENADIAKGSFYQYFDDKKDIFKYIVDLGTQKKIAYLEHVSANFTNMSFFEIIRELYIGGIMFSKENPKLANIGYNFINSTDDNFKNEVYGENLPKSNQMFLVFLQQGIEKGEINPDIDLELVSQMMTTLSVSIGEYFLKEVKKVDNMEILDLVDKMLFVLRNGIEKRS